LTQELPPPPPDETPGMLQVPLKHLKTLAKYYVDLNWLVKMGAKATGQKIPAELDEMMRTIAASDDPAAVEKLQRMATGEQDTYDIESREIPEPRIGERVLTQDLAQRAWDLYHKQGLSYREIAKFFTEELGAPCSHATIASYIGDIDEQHAEFDAHRHETAKTVAKIAAFIGGAVTVGLVLGHFLL
jgi:hypothetical protein